MRCVKLHCPQATLPGSRLRYHGRSQALQICRKQHLQQESSRNCRRTHAYAGAREREAEVAQQDFLVAESYRAVEDELRDEAVLPSVNSPDSDVWSSKPPWCQPWTIVLTGALAISTVWKLSDGNVLVSAIVAVPVAIWWYLFLGVMPQAYREYVQGLPARSSERHEPPSLL